MNYRNILLAFALATLAGSGVAAAQCPPDCPIKGGGDAATDCHSELASDVVRLNYPSYDPNNVKPGKELRCFDGDPGCDLDGEVNNSCDFDVDLCLHNADPDLLSCTPTNVTAMLIDGDTTGFPGLGSLQTAVNGLLPASTNVCTAGQLVTVALKGPNGKGEFKKTKLSFKTVATAATIDEDSFKFVCLPRLWPSHSYDAANTRANPVETVLGTGNVSTLVEKWRFNVPGGIAGGPVSSTVTVGAKLVYTSAWDGKVYALKKKTGAVVWSFNTGSGGILGVQSSVTITPDGRVLVADSAGELYCLSGKKGDLLWQAHAGTEDPAAAHAWGSPTIANNRVLIGIASHNDAPCTRGTLIAYDLDTGAELWRQHTVPENICYADTADECNVNSDCGVVEEAAGSPCLLGKCDSNADQTCTSDGQCPYTFLKPGTCVAPPPALVGECFLNQIGRAHV